MSIFEKHCPQCTAANPVSAVLCACGYCFDPQAVTDHKAVVQAAMHEERLYHDYLAARLVQAEAVYEVARADALADPGNTYKAAQALTAEQALNTARAELRQQTDKASHLKKQAASQTPAVEPTVEPTVVPSHKPRAIKRKSNHPTPAARTTKARVETKPVAAAALAKLAPVAAPVIAAAPTAKKRALPVASAPSAPAAAPHVEPAPAPSQAFRQRQARHAEAIARKALALATPPAAPRPVASAAPVKAAPKQKPAATKECPNCTAKVPTQLPQCRCGFGFSTASIEMASLPLDAAALAILRR